MRIFEIYFLSNFKIYNTVLLTVVSMLYITTSAFIYFITRSCTFWPPSPISNTLFYRWENWGPDWFINSPRTCNSVAEKRDQALLNLVALMWSVPERSEPLSMWLCVQLHSCKSFYNYRQVKIAVWFDHFSISLEVRSLLLSPFDSYVVVLY